MYSTLHALLEKSGILCAVESGYPEFGIKRLTL